MINTTENRIEAIHTHDTPFSPVRAENLALPDVDVKSLLLRDALAILTVVGALAAFYGILKLVSLISGLPFP